MKDRSSIAGYIVALEAVVIPLVRSHLAELTPEQRKEFSKQVMEECAAVSGEILAQAPVTGRGAALNPDAARRAALRIQKEAEGLVVDFMTDLVPATPPALLAPKSVDKDPPK